MTTVDDLAAVNAALPSAPSDLAAPPSRHVAVVTCMDARIDPVALFTLGAGEAHVIRNAGGLVTDDVLRSLTISQHALGTTEIMLVQHTACGMKDFDDETFRAGLAAESGETPPWDVPGFADVAESVRSGVARLRTCGWLPHRDGVRGFVLDVSTGRVAEV